MSTLTPICCVASDIFVAADSELLVRALSNLLRNACRHAAPAHPSGLPAVLLVSQACRSQQGRRNGFIEHFAMQSPQGVALGLPSGRVIVRGKSRGVHGDSRFT